MANEMKIDITEMSEAERETMVQKFKSASLEDKTAMYKQFESLRAENISDQQRSFLSELEADFRAVDFSAWEEESE